MDSTDIANLRAAVEALNDRDIEPFVALMAEDMVWQGAPHGWLWWKHTPS